MLQPCQYYTVVTSTWDCKREGIEKGDSSLVRIVAEAASTHNEAIPAHKSEMI
jgi:hypothetical protein